MSIFDNAAESADVLAYKPDRAGEAVEGTIVALDVTSSEYTTDDIPVITLRQDDGILRSVRGYHTTLRRDLEKLGLQVGDYLGIRYDGKKQTKDGKRSFHAYTVLGTKATSAVAAGTSDGVDSPPPF